MKLLNYKKVLCLSPHPDDVEYGMLGTILKYTDTQFDIITISAGGEFDNSEDNIRHKECREVWNGINNLNGIFFDLDYIKNITEDKLIYHITKTVDLSTYESLCVPSKLDGHQDHRKISGISLALVRRYACSILEYRTPSVDEEWIPNLFIDLNINDVWNNKMKRLKLFESQQDKTYFGKNSLISFHSNYQCSNKNKNKVESFKIRRLYS